MRSSLRIRVNKFNINYLLIIATACFSLTPYLARNLSRTIQIAIICAWVISYMIVLVRYKTNRGHLVLVTIITIWQIWEVILKIVGYSSASWGNYFVGIVFYCIMCMALFIQDFMDVKQKKTIAWTVYLIIFFNIVSNLYLYYLYPDAHSLVNHPGVTTYREMNVGATSFYATTLIYCGICFVIFLNSRKIGIRIISVLGIFLSFYFLTNAVPRATALSLLILMTALILIDHLSKGRKLLYYFITLLSFIIVIVITIPVLNYLIGVVNSDRLAIRIQEMVYFLQGDLLIEYRASTFGTRIILAGTSLKSFTSGFVSMIIGIGNHIDVDAFSTGIGQHSGFIDTLGKYGIIGGIFVANIFIRAYCYIKNLVGKKVYCNQIMIIFAIFIVYGFLNYNLRMDIGAVAFILLPLIPYLIDEGNNKIHKKNGEIS